MINVFAIVFLCTNYILTNCEEITPYKFKDYSNLPNYIIPPSSRFTTPRTNPYEPDLVYYFSKAKTATYPLAILCTGSSSGNAISSVIHFHRYFLQEFMDMDVGVITVEQWGVDGNHINKKEFMEHYTRSQRLQDHIALIEHIMAHPPHGWNGTFIFLGVSEGGPLVLSLTERYQNNLIATINWCGAGSWNWREELWAFLIDIRQNGPWWFKSLDYVTTLLRFPFFPPTKIEFDKCMYEAKMNPSVEKKFMGMTYKYHCDALDYPELDYTKLKKPLLIVAGAKDYIIQSCDEFVHKAYAACANVTYLRIDDMDHYIRARPDIIDQSFAWLKEQIANRETN